MPEPEAISFGRLLDWVEGRLSEEESRAVEEQVAASGSATRADVDWLRAFARVSEGVTLDSPPPEVHSELVKRFEEYAGGQRRAGFLRRFVAALSFDSELGWPVADLRATGTQESHRQIIYGTEVADVALDIHSGAGQGHLDIHGQIFPAGDAELGIFSVELLEGLDEPRIATTNDLGEFAFQAVRPGVYEMLLSTDQVEITIASIELDS